MSPLNSIWVHIKWAPLNVSKIDQIPGRKYENRNGKNENPKTDLILLGNSRLMIIQVVCCTISINSTHPRDCDTLDQFDTSTQVAGDRDKAKISTLNNCNEARIGDFWEYLHPIGCGRRPHEPNLVKTSTNIRFLTTFSVFWHCHTLDLSDTGLCDLWHRPIFDTTVGSVMCDVSNWSKWYSVSISW